MKSTIVLAMIAILFTTKLQAQASGYTISGKIKDLPDGTTFYLIQSTYDGEADTVSRVKSKGGQFTFKGMLKEEGQVAFVKMDTSLVKLVNKLNSDSDISRSWIRLFLENSKTVIELTGDLKKWPEIDIKGSLLTNKYDEFASAMSSALLRAQEKITAASGDPTKKRDTVKLAEAIREYNSALLKNLEMISDSYVVPLSLFNAKTLPLELKDDAYQKLSAKLKNSYYGKRLKQQIANTKASKNIGIGRVIPDFQVKSPEGKFESVRKLAMKSKYTLVDFWASWCIPCRTDIPNMKKVYEAFHSKGFNIVSVSTDSKLDSWQKALKEENTPWTNGMQEGEVDKEIFGLTSIPAYILLNEKAEIIQMDLNSNFFSRSGGTVNGAQVVIENSKTKRLRGDDLYQVIEGLLGQSK